MEFVGVVLILLSMTGWVAGFIGLIRPSLLANKKLGAAPSRKQISLGMISLLVLFAVGGSLLPEAKDATPPENLSNAPTPIKEYPKLDISLHEWVAKMNAQLKNIKRDALAVSTEKVECDIWCVSNYTMGKTTLYMVSYKNDRINEITMISSGDGSIVAGAEIMLGLLSMTQVLSDGVPKQEISKSTLAFLEDALDTGKSNKRIGDIHYRASKIDGIGLLVAASK